MTLGELQNRYYKAGQVERISIRSERLKPVTILETIEAIKDIGLRGDHYQNPGGNRQVTLIQAEHLKVVALLLDSANISLEMTRRNIEVSGINLLSLKGKRFRIGKAYLSIPENVTLVREWKKVWGLEDIAPCEGTGESLRELFKADPFRLAIKLRLKMIRLVSKNNASLH